MTRRVDRERLFALIERRLAAGQPVPGDAELADRFGFWTIEQARTTLAALADDGRITIAGYGDDRVIALATPRAPKVDPAVEAGTQRILSILGMKPSAPKARQGEEDVANPKPSEDFRNIGVLARGPLLRAIAARAEELDVTLPKAAISLIEQALAPAPAAPPAAPTISDIPADALLRELARRLEASASPAAVAAAIARAESAEGQLAALRQQISGLLGG